MRPDRRDIRTARRDRRNVILQRDAQRWRVRGSAAPDLGVRIGDPLAGRRDTLRRFGRSGVGDQRHAPGREPEVDRGPAHALQRRPERRPLRVDAVTHRTVTQVHELRDTHSSPHAARPNVGALDARLGRPKPKIAATVIKPSGSDARDAAAQRTLRPRSLQSLHVAHRSATTEEKALTRRHSVTTSIIRNTPDTHRANAVPRDRASSKPTRSRMVRRRRTSWEGYDYP